MRPNVRLHEVSLHPAWLAAEAPHVDVILSTRTRVMRNLRAHVFPHRATNQDHLAILKEITLAARPLGWHSRESITTSERNALVACRMVSPDFKWTEPGRGFLLDPGHCLSLMINEEDHLRVQALTAGWSAAVSDQRAFAALDVLGELLDWAWSPDFGYLSASPFNAGEGVRQSCMAHLVGLAHAKRLPAVINALAEQGITIRGLFGETSRAVGAFVQISILRRSLGDFVGAVDYLLKEERAARSRLDPSELRERVERAMEFVHASESVSLADALRVLGWLRWGALAAPDLVNLGPRRIDELLTYLEVKQYGTLDDGPDRAEFLRFELGL
ncbi:MAG: hypothetical protein ACOYON_02405 [Fimbriimonas sp.]